jgi:hypothetical protein
MVVNLPAVGLARDVAMTAASVSGTCYQNDNSIIKMTLSF